MRTIQGKGNEMSTGQQKMPNRTTVAKAAAESDGLVDANPLSSVLIVFGIGLGVGVALGCMLTGPTAPRATFAQRTELAAEKFGRRMLDAMSGVLPQSLSKHIS
jgi:hypothetical protein